MRARDSAAGSSRSRRDDRGCDPVAVPTPRYQYTRQFEFASGVTRQRRLRPGEPSIGPRRTPWYRQTATVPTADGSVSTTARACLTPDLPFATERACSRTWRAIRTSLGAGVPPVAFSSTVTPRAALGVAWPSGGRLGVRRRSARSARDVSIRRRSHRVGVSVHGDEPLPQAAAGGLPALDGRGLGRPGNGGRVRLAV